MRWRQTTLWRRHVKAQLLASSGDEPRQGPQTGQVVEDEDQDHVLEAICDGPRLLADKPGWERLVEAMAEALEAAGAGEVDGVMDKGDEEASVVCYGPDAEAMLRAVEPLLRDYPPCTRVELRYGDEDAEERVIQLRSG